MVSLGATNPFPAAAQRVHVGSPALPAPFASGWYGLDLNTSVASAGPVPPIDPTVAQAWVLTSLAFTTDQSSGMNAVRLDSACRPRHLGP